MKSKTNRLIAAGLILIITGSWAWWQLRPKPKSGFTDKEISIKQTEIPNVETVTYRDWSGFQFDYPSIVTVKEIELDNNQIYSSLELNANDSNKLTIRISDTQISNLEDWQKIFNEQHSLRKLNQTQLADLPAVELFYGAPEMKLTVAVNNGILYEIQNQADDSFWDLTHNDLIASWKFTLTAPTSPTTVIDNTDNNDGPITLIEEVLE